MNARIFQKIGLSVIIISIVSMCFFWIIRVETRAAELESRVTEYHRILNQNKDQLDGLSGFHRSLKGGDPYLSLAPGSVQLGTSKSTFILGETAILLQGIMPGVEITLSSDQTNLRIGADIIELWNDLMRIYLDQQKERIYVGNTDASLRIGKIEGAKGDMEEGIIILNNPNSNKGGYVLISDNVLRIKSTNVPVEIIKGDCTIKIENDNIEFLAKGDINITSENGNINLEGKRINFNE